MSTANTNPTNSFSDHLLKWLKIAGATIAILTPVAVVSFNYGKSQSCVAEREENVALGVQIDSLRNNEIDLREASSISRTKLGQLDIRYKDLQGIHSATKENLDGWILHAKELETMLQSKDMEIKELRKKSISSDKCEFVKELIIDIRKQIKEKNSSITIWDTDDDRANKVAEIALLERQFRDIQARLDSCDK